jgi:16S rRNA (adenine1518-N6/adenine1519-N6)-dimethyltransferase
VGSEQAASGAAEPRLLGSTDIRALAARYQIRPARRHGQNFVVDPNTVRRIVRTAALEPDDVVLEIGPGLGSLTLELLTRAAGVIAVEVDPVLAAALPTTVQEYAPLQADHLTVLPMDALDLTEPPTPAPTTIVANLPYNVAVPVVLHVLELLPTATRGLVMVQLEVAQRLAATPGSRTYGIPSVKAAWYAQLRQAGQVSRSVFWPPPRVDSGLVEWRRRPPPASWAQREPTFAVVDAAFAQRRKTLRAALAACAGSTARAESGLRAAGVDPSLRGEGLDVSDFARIAEAFAGLR